MNKNNKSSKRNEKRRHRTLDLEHFLMLSSNSSTDTQGSFLESFRVFRHFIHLLSSFLCEHWLNLWIICYASVSRVVAVKSLI